MKPSSGRLAFLRIFVWVVAVVVAVGYYGHVRAQSAGGSQALVIPLRPIAPLSTVPVPPVFGMEGILADKTAAIALGKALFWDMQAGSDDVQACASCHFNAGADSRAINQINPGQAGGDNAFSIGSAPNYHMKPGSPEAGFGGYHDGDYPFHKLADVDQGLTLISDANDVTGSQGVAGMTKDKVVVETRINPPGVDDVNGAGNDPLLGHDKAKGGDDESMSYGNGQHPGPIHNTPGSRRDIINEGAGSNGSNG
ncbi:MAG TPA: cytochrome c peroxidase, partial [Verrucomicrobiae bacterium]|nr:cytochrome c peroxidase [Verrucomicrobiae bacterium]